MSENTSLQQKFTKPGPKELLLRYLPYLPLVILSVIIAGALAWVKLRYTTPVYSVSGKLLVKDDNPYNNSGEKFSGIFALQESSTNLNNEIQIIKSRSMAARVIRTNNLQFQYYIKGKIRTSEASSEDMPFSWEVESIQDSTQALVFNITIVSNEQYRINEENTTYNFGQRVSQGACVFRLIPKTGSGMNASPESQFIIGWFPVDKLTAGYSSKINIVQQEGAHVLNVNYNTTNIKNGLVVVNGYMREYQLSGLEEKRQTAINTLDFINEQLDTLKGELGGVEQNLQNFRERNQIYDTKTQTEEDFARYSETQKLLTEQGVKIKVVDYLYKYVADGQNINKLVPSNLGIDEPSLITQISAFNELQLRKESALNTTTAENPGVRDLQTAIEKLRGDILQNLRNVKNAILLSNEELAKLISSTSANLKSIPSKEKQLLEVTRRQAILQELYSFLLQKKLETAISSASTASDIRILEPAMASGIPIEPNSRGLYTIAFFLGLAIPVGAIFLKEFLNDKVTSRNDIEAITEAPILGEVSHADDANALVVKENNRSYVAEQFRIIRSNLQFILPKNDKPVILVTSTFSGEGKSFISTNLGSVLALSGKKTVILEMDIRKPKILRGLGMQERKGITNFVVSNIRVEDIIYKVPDAEDMYVIPCGPVPPNPGEILLDDKIADLFEELKRKFDAIIIDSAPVGLVSDGISLAQYANATVYIVRHNYTLKKQLQLADELFERKKLPHLSVVINDIQLRAGGYGSYYGYGYGYGYGRKEGASQYFNLKDKPKSWLSRFFNFFKF